MQCPCDIEPASRNVFLFARDINTEYYGEKENGQTADFCNLSALALRNSEMLNL